MALALSAENQKVALASIRRFCDGELEVDLSDIQVSLLLGFLLREIGPSIYNLGVSAAQAFLRDRLVDLEATCYEPEFVYWPKSSIVRRQR